MSLLDTTTLSVEISRGLISVLRGTLCTRKSCHTIGKKAMGKKNMISFSSRMLIGHKVTICASDQFMNKTAKISPPRIASVQLQFVRAVIVGRKSFPYLMEGDGVQKSKARNPYPTRIAVDTHLPRFIYQELAEATCVFKDELGKGDFGIVYIGVIGINIVAVKKLYRVFQESEKEFQAEVNGVARTHQKKLVQLLGYCKEGDQRLLIYEYMSNGTIASFLFRDIRPCWEQRRNISLGIAKGLSCLHEECSTQVIHCDIKPQNILLDGYHNAKISDFGLAKILMINQSQTSTGIRGTKGYVAPEWFGNTPITARVDVYSGNLSM